MNRWLLSAQEHEYLVEARRNHRRMLRGMPTELAQQALSRMAPQRVEVPGGEAELVEMRLRKIIDALLATGAPLNLDDQQLMGIYHAVNERPRWRNVLRAYAEHRLVTEAKSALGGYLGAAMAPGEVVGVGPVPSADAYHLPSDFDVSDHDEPALFVLLALLADRVVADGYSDPRDPAQAEGPGTYL